MFDMEKDQSRKEAQADGKFVKVPGGAFLMGGYEYDFEQRVRIVYAFFEKPSILKNNVHV